MAKDKKTTGEVSLELLSKKQDPVLVIDQARSQLSSYQENIIECVNSNKNRLDKDFYVTVLTKKERLLPNVLRNYFFARASCPTPDYDQIVYKYMRSSEEIKLLWVIPSKDACIYMIKNKHLIPKEEEELLSYVLAFESGELYKKSVILNKEIEVK